MASDSSSNNAKIGIQLSAPKKKFSNSIASSSSSSSSLAVFEDAVAASSSTDGSNILAGGVFIYNASSDKAVEDDGDTGPPIVIPLQAPINKGDKKQPLLLENVNPELFEIHNEKARFEKDVSLRAKDVDFASDEYKAVPVDKFGEAMLRGMGFTGSLKSQVKDDKDKYKVVMREPGLGLGATVKPPDESIANKKVNNARAAVWNSLAEDKLKNQNLEVGDIVWITNIKFTGKRGKVLGFSSADVEKVNVELEGSGGGASLSWASSSSLVIDFAKSELLKLSESDLQSNPYDNNSNSNSNNNSNSSSNSNHNSNSNSNWEKEKDRRDDQRDDRKHDSKRNDRSRDRDHDDRKRDRSRDRDREKDRKRDRDRSRDRDERDSKKHSSSSSSSNSSSSSSSSSSSTSLPSSSNTWLTEGIRVKLISKKYGDDIYLQKGSIVHASTRESTGTIKFDSGVKVEKIREKDLETVLPSAGDDCLVVLGPHAGSKATLISKDKERNLAVVRLIHRDRKGGGDQIELKMDAVAAFAYPKP